MRSEYREYQKELIEEKRLKYFEGIRSQLSVSEIVRAECMTFTQKFIEKFPHLKRVPGFHVTNYGETEHWWCVDTDGTIVDPTAEQFTPGTYREYDAEKDEIYLGKCHNCGSEIYGLKSEGRKGICSTECADDYEKYLSG